MKTPTKAKLAIAILILLTFICPNTSSAQDEIDTSFNNRMNYVFGALEKNRVPNGMLLDYAMEFTDVRAFNGAVLVDSNYADYTVIGDIYNTLISSRIHSNAVGLINPTAWDSLWFIQRQNGIITLSGTFFNYSRFRDDAVSNGFLAISNDQFLDRYVGGVWQNPYTTENVFAVAPATDYYEGTNLQIILPSNLWFTNSASLISSISIDVSDGLGYRILSPGQYLSINYGDTGRKEWKFKLTLSGGAIFYAHSSVLIKSDPYDSNNGQSRSASTNSDLDTNSFTATQSYLGQFASGWTTIHFANADKVLRRPLIVVEGFDPGHITHPERWWGNLGIKNFRDLVDLSGSTKLKSVLGSSSQQYDIIYVDWKRGTDYIQRNALLLEDIIRWVNDNKQPVDGILQPLVVIGQSMGGLIARWALKDMESHNENHQTRLFISYDSPHLGANVPLGYQYMAKHARSLYLRTGAFPFIEFIQFIRHRASPIKTLSVANTPAAKQMLINWINDNNQVDNTLHNQWQSELQSKGYPSQYGIWNVAVSNGSECGITQPYSPGAVLLDYNGKANTRFLSDLILLSTSLGHDAILYSAILTGQPAFLLGFVPGKNEIKFEIKVNAQPQGTADRLYRGRISYKKTWLWLIPVQVDITNKNYYANPSTLPYDYYPGGQITDGVDLQSSSYQDWFIKYNVTASHIQTFSFIPTPSALDIGSGSATLINSDYLAQYVGANPPSAPKNSPFQNFITAFNVSSTINNEEHTDILERNGDWVADELNGTHPSVNCSFICSSPGITISGPATLCNTPLVYTLNNPPTGTTRTWAAFPSGIVSISPSPDGSQATVTKISNGYFILKVTISATNCGSLEVNSSQIRAGGYSSSDYPITGTSSACKNQTVYYSTNSLQGATNYQWTWSSNMTYISGQGTPNLTLKTGSTTGTANITVRVANTCDAGGSPAVKFTQINNCGFSFTASPNPTSGNVNVVVDQSQEAMGTGTPTKIYEIKILDQLGNVRKQYRYPSGISNTSISLSSLPAGHYAIEAYDGSEWSSRIVIKQ